MIKKSLKIFTLGFLSGILFIYLVPSAYTIIFGALHEKTEIQGKVIKSPFFCIFINNLIASFISAYGGMFLSKVFIFLKSDKKSIKYSLLVFPYSILFLNGFILGIFFEYLGVFKFLRGILPHGIFEIPAIIISGSIGIEIGEKSNYEKIKFFAKKHVKNYFMVVVLLFIAANLEA